METIINGYKIFKNHPIFLLPLFITWIIMTSGIVYFKWHFPWDNYDLKGKLFFCYLFYAISSFSIIISCSILVELIEQDEYGKKMNLKKAAIDSFTENIGHLILLSIIWSFVWFLLVFLKTIFSRKRNDGTTKESAENIARTLSGDGSFSYATFTFNLLIKTVRMIMFVIIPSFAWEKNSFVASIKRGLSIISARSAKFIEGFVVTQGANFIVLIPPSILLYIRKVANLELSDIWWYGCILYLGIAWSFIMYLEQLFGAELYLWQLKYENACKEAEKNNMPLPSFNEIQKPNLLDEINDLEILEVNA